MKPKDCLDCFVALAMFALFAAIIYCGYSGLVHSKLKSEAG